VLARAAAAPAQTQRELSDAWESAIREAGLPLAWSEGATPRPRISIGAPLPVGMSAGGELLDIVLTERWPIYRVREALTRAMPDGWRLVDLQDVWLAGPALAGRIAAADYRITLADPAARAEVLEPACARLLAAERISRERAKGSGTVTYDLRPLVIALRVTDAGPPVVLSARTRFHPELGTGRPEEVVAALGDLAGSPLVVEAIVRERLILAEDLD
jgi:radical SAM-linked protein